MLEIVAAAGLVAGIVVALTRAAPTTDRPLVARREVPLPVGAAALDRTGGSHWDSPAPSFADLPCPWCRAATAESDRRCPSCGQPFG